MNAGTPKVFISYRREDSSAYAGRLYDAAAARFGEENVFMDIELPPGVDFVDRINAVVSACHVLLVVIGPKWASARRERDAQPRLEDPQDFVRLEIQIALRRSDVTVIPLLVAGTTMPDPTDLPEDLRALTRRNALELSDSRWRYDVGRVLASLDLLLGGTSAPAPPESPGPAAVAPEHPVGRGGQIRSLVRRHRPLAIAALVIAVIAVGAAVIATRHSALDTLRDQVPASIRSSCSHKENWMVSDNHADAQVNCDPPVGNYLTYGLWPDARSARAFVRDARARGPSCQASTVTAMIDILALDRVTCEIHDHSVNMLWTNRGSRVAAQFSSNQPISEQTAVAHWKRVALRSR